MFGGDDEEDDFLSPAGGAKLACLFGVDQHMSQTNESFQYTAPKQPRKSSTSAPASQKAVPPPGAPSVLFGTAVQAFRYINGQYVKQGKLGLAVLGNHITKEYKLLLYLNQQKQVAAAKIHVGFVLTVQPNNYCTFYDDQRQNWSMMFDSEKAISGFCKEICLAKANSVASLDTVVIQDLSLGEGQAVDNGDVLEVLYTGWLLQNHTIGQMFDSNHNLGKSMRLKVGAGKVIKGLEDGMLGMKKSGRRLLIIPPNLAYGSKAVSNHALSNSTLIFEADLCRVKFFKDSESDHNTSIESVAPSLTRSAAPSMENLPTEPTGPEILGQPPHCAKPQSHSEQLANPDATKAKLISRMAKMGQPMFPFIKDVASHPESSDSEVEDVSSNRLNNQLAPSSPVQISTAAPVSAHPVASTILSVTSNVAPQPGMLGSSHAFQAYPCTPLMTSSQLHPAGQVHPAQTIPYFGDVTSFLMTEARQHNTEIRQSIGKVADKVEQLTSKIDILQRQGSLFMGSPTISMDTSMIMYNIQRIVQENECLKREVLEKSSCVEKQNCKIAELITQNQRYMEHSDRMLENRNNFLKSSNEQCQVRLLEAEQEKVDLMKDLASSKAQLSQLHLQASTQQQKATELQTKLMSVLQSNESQSQIIAGLETKLKDVMEAAEKSQAQHRLEKQRCEEMELRVHKIEEELEELKSDNERLEPEALEEEGWKEKCLKMMSAEKQHRGDLARLAEQRDTLRDELTQLQDKYTVLEQHGETVKRKLERRVAELEKKLTQQESSRDTSVKVKQVMNEVFHSLRGEFDLCESYSGQAILEVILSTIKTVTLQLLSGSGGSSLSKNEEEKDKSNDVKQPEDTLHWNVPAKNEREMKEDRKAEPDLRQVSESYTETAEEEGRVTESKTQGQVKKLIATNIHQATTSTNLNKMTAPGHEVEKPQAENSASQISAGDTSTERVNPDDYEPDRSSPGSAGPNKRVVDDGGHVGEVNNTSPKGLRHPSSPPPISELQNDSGSYPSLTGQAFDNNGEIKPPSAPANEEEEDDINLKGRPPSLFGDDDDDDDA